MTQEDGAGHDTTERFVFGGDVDRLGPRAGRTRRGGRGGAGGRRLRRGSARRPGGLAAPGREEQQREGGERRPEWPLPRPPPHYCWAGRPFASRARWRDHVSSTMRVLVPVTRPRRRSCSITWPRRSTSGTWSQTSASGIAGRGEDRLHLGELHRRLLDLLQVGGPGKAHFGEGLNRTPGLAVVDDDRVPGDHPGALEALDTPGHRGGGQRDLLTDVGHRPAGVVRQQFDDVVIYRVEVLSSHGSEA